MQLKNLNGILNPMEMNITVYINAGDHAKRTTQTFATYFFTNQHILITGLYTSTRYYV